MRELAEQREPAGEHAQGVASSPTGAMRFEVDQLASLAQPMGAGDRKTVRPSSASCLTYDSPCRMRRHIRARHVS